MMDLHGLLKLSQVPGVGSNRLRALISQFETPSAVFEASPRELVKVPGVEEKTARNIAHFKDGRQFAEEQLKRLKKIGGRLLTLWDDEYPDLLKWIYDPPPYLFTIGSFTEYDKYSIAIVGTRNPSTYGKLLTEKFTAELCALGITIVSGLARGIDTIAHATSVKNSARTNAVIGSGIDVIYPPENKKLTERIVSDGVLLSEFEMGAKPDAEHFPRRNRIISGLSLGTLIVETDINGGAMITARWALDQNREVFAIPGSIRERRNAGCNALIKRGEAKLVQNVDDILIELASKLQPLLKETDKARSVGHEGVRAGTELSLFEKKIFDVLEDAPLHIDAIAARADATTSDALVQLLGLEFKGLVKQLPGKLFVRI